MELCQAREIRGLQLWYSFIFFSMLYLLKLYREKRLRKKLSRFCSSLKRRHTLRECKRNSITKCGFIHECFSLDRTRCGRNIFSTCVFLDVFLSLFCCGWPLRRFALLFGLQVQNRGGCFVKSFPWHGFFAFEMDSVVMTPRMHETIRRTNVTALVAGVPSVLPNRYFRYEGMFLGWSPPAVGAARWKHASVNVWLLVCFGP